MCVCVCVFTWTKQLLPTTNYKLPLQMAEWMNTVRVCTRRPVSDCYTKVGVSHMLEILPIAPLAPTQTRTNDDTTQHYTSEIRTPLLIRTLCMVPATKRDVLNYPRNEDTTFNQDTVMHQHTDS